MRVCKSLLYAISHLSSFACFICLSMPNNIFWTCAVEKLYQFIHSASAVLLIIWCRPCIKAYTRNYSYILYYISMDNLVLHFGLQTVYPVSLSPSFFIMVFVCRWPMSILFWDIIRSSIQFGNIHRYVLPLSICVIHISYCTGIYD